MSDVFDDLARAYSAGMRDGRSECAEEIERLREALRTIADGDTPREHAIVYRSDGVHSKHDKCKHGAWMYDGCEDCVTEYAIAALGEGKEEKQLVWPNPSPPTEGVSPYNHVKAHGFTIEWKSWKDRPQYTLVRDHKDEEFLGSFDTLEDAKEAARAALGEGK